MKTCPGPFRGRIAFPVPLHCDAIHLLLGILTGSFLVLEAGVGHRTTRTLLVCFILYQALEELPDNDWLSFVKDCGIFLIGIGLVWLAKGMLLAPSSRVAMAPGGCRPCKFV